MIRLIASDMDGTLLDEHSQVPEGTFELITALQEKGIRFCAGSGRRYDTLREFFGPIADRIDYVASAGTQVYAKGILLDYEVFSSRSVQRLYDLCAQLDCLHLALYDRTNTFLLDDLDHYVREIDKDLPRAVRVQRLPAPDVGIVKAAICYERADDIMDMAYVLERELGDAFMFMPSGRTWIDVVPRGINKATGLQAVLAHYSIDPRDVLAFGDSMNDYAMLRYVGHPYVMGNARNALKHVAEKVLGTNREQAVQAELRVLLEAR